MNATTALRPYEHPWEHITDELRRLDVWIDAGLQSMTAPADDPALDPFRGLVVTESEAKQLLQDDGRFAAIDHERQQELDAWDGYIASRVSSTIQQGYPLPLLRLRDAFRLTDRDVRCLVATMAPDLDRKYEKLYAYLQDDMTSKFATVDLLLRLCCRSESERRDALPRLLPYSPFSSLLRKEQPDGGAARSALSRPIRADERIVAYALGLHWTYAGPMAGMRRYDAAEIPPSLTIDQDVGEKLQAHIAASPSSPVVYLLHGPTGCGKTLQARLAAASIRCGLLEWDASTAPAEEEPFREALELVMREALLIGAVPAFDRLHALAGDRRLEWLADRLRGLEGPAFLLSEKPWMPERPLEGAAWIDVPLRLPDPAARRQLWKAAAGGAFALSDAEASALSAKFRFTTGRIERTVRTAERLLEWERGGGLAEAPLDSKALHRAGYMQVRHRLGEKAVKLEPKFAWEDLILPDDTKSLLRQACNRLSYRHVVFDEWGFERKFAYGKGISMLFTGPPGTGKTMSAMVMAREMDAELYRIDLSRMVSKYIGETEKNLSDIFDEAQLSGAILFFDEADALFGKRSEVKDAHDKYANMETSFLLQKMEEYDGLTILATNFSQNLDEAFTRRIQFIVRYPFPDPAQREQLWRSTFPKESPVVHDIDFEYLSRAFDLAGGPIKNVVLTAAFLAAEDGVPIGMKHMIEAVKQEYKKTGKVLLKDRLGAYADC
ncbi:ATP-binding protein [Paenibacillus sp.]|uniref:AAA family ATPase n=1 Tax=Paenibacillus sp. TaxID=58172 RepID=UPI0028118726|nr:ATP-binding protein [Paenibacillus sp.]